MTRATLSCSRQRPRMQSVVLGKDARSDLKAYRSIPADDRDGVLLLEIV